MAFNKGNIPLRDDPTPGYLNATERITEAQYNTGQKELAEAIDGAPEPAVKDHDFTVLADAAYTISSIYTLTQNETYTASLTGAKVLGGQFWQVTGDGSILTFSGFSTNLGSDQLVTTNGELHKFVAMYDGNNFTLQFLGAIPAPTVTPPVLVTATVESANADQIIFTYDKALDAGSTPVVAGYPNINGTITGSNPATSVLVSGSTVTVTCTTDFVSTDEIDGDYDSVLAVNPVRESTGDENAADFSDLVIDNNIAAIPNAPIFTFASFEVGNIDDSTIDLPTDATLDGTSLALTTDFVLRINATPDPVTNVAYNGQNVRLTSTTPIENGDVVDIAYSGTAVRNNAAPNTPAATFTTTSVTNNVAVGAFDPSTISTEFLGLPLDIANTNADPVTLASDILTTTPYNFSNVGTVNRAIENSEECIRVGDVEGNLESVSSALSGLFQDSFSFHMKVKLDDATPLATQYFCRINNGTISRFWIDLRSTGLITVAYTANSVNVFAQTNAAVALSTTDFSQLVVTVPSGGTIDILLDGASQALNPSFDGDMSGVNMALFNSAAAQLNIASEDIGASRIDGWVRQVYLQDVVYTAQNITDLATL